MNFTSNENFEREKESFLNLDTRLVDKELSEVLELWKSSPYNNYFVPRWSCQSHSTDNGESEYYIIFSVHKNSLNYMYMLFDLVNNEYLKFRHNDTAAVKMKFINLIHIFDGEMSEPCLHVSIDITTYGVQQNIKCAKEAFKHACYELQKIAYEDL